METNLLQYAGACLALVVGLTGLFKPTKMESLVGLTFANTVGHIEIRVLFGSFLVALPIAAMIYGKADIFVFYGLAAVAAGIIKTVFTVIDQCSLASIATGILVDIVLALLLCSSLFL